MIACIGMIAADLTVKPVEKLPKLGFLSPVDSISIHTGGCAANSAIDLCKMGFETEIFGMIGDDFFGKFIVQEFKKANVKMRGLKISESCTTGTTIALIHPQGERRFLYSGAANDLFGYDDIEWKLIESCDIVFITGTLLLNSLVGLPCAKVLKKAKALGKITALDTVWDHTGRWMSLLESCIPYIDYFMPSLDEAIQLSGEKNLEDIANVFLGMGARNIIIKMGKEGAYFKNKDHTALYKTFSFIHPVDTIGAGDAFCAGFLGALSMGWNLEDCMNYANAVGTHCIMNAGASDGIKSMAETIAFIKQYLGKIG